MINRIANEGGGRGGGGSNNYASRQEVGPGDETPARIEEEAAGWEEEEEDASHVPKSSCHVSLNPPLLALLPGDSKIKSDLELYRGK
ncbi:hypothetical protein GW17_00025252 [Ensete ventricosum]|nr:hypothetical protein GW17_00025252 [Ensete ventricosum]